MAISHIPSAGDVLNCDFGPDPESVVTPGVMYGPLAVPPEIFKLRPVAVLSTIGKISIVVPFSTSEPKVIKNYQVHVLKGTYGFLTGSADSWLKADLIEAVSHARLDRLRVGGVFQRARLSPQHLKELRIACLHAIQLGRLAASV